MGEFCIHSDSFSNSAMVLHISLLVMKGVRQIESALFVSQKYFLLRQN